MNDWLDRTRLLLGEEKLARLERAHVLVVGLGGVGAYAAEQLCRAGIGEMTVIDGDVVEPTNKNRQLLDEFVRDDRMLSILRAAAYDYVVDAIDTLAPKIFLIYHSLQLGLPVVSSMGSGGKLDPSKIQVADISKSYNCALARMLRKRLHKLGVYKGVKVVFSPEVTDPSAVVLDEGQNKKSNVGTISYMPALFGCHAASVVIRDLLENSLS